MISFAVIGGILLNLGAYFTFKGKIYEAVGIYLLADACWIVMAFQKDDMIGVAFISVGFTFGLLAFLKMKSGTMSKDINKESNDL